MPIAYSLSSTELTHKKRRIWRINTEKKGVEVPQDNFHYIIHRKSRAERQIHSKAVPQSRSWTTSHNVWNCYSKMKLGDTQASPNARFSRGTNERKEAAWRLLKNDPWNEVISKDSDSHAIILGGYY